jgi:hypothetical protein
MNETTVTMLLSRFNELKEAERMQLEKLIKIYINGGYDCMENKFTSVGECTSGIESDVVNLINSEISPVLKDVVNTKDIRIMELEGFRKSHFYAIVLSSIVTALIIKLLY